ncbi:MAG: LytR/AlgR family response regulator transcription factor [Cellulosilyticaceae bacterium]
MFKIAICDDEMIICSQIESIIFKYKKELGEEIGVDVYFSGEELYSFMKGGATYDLIFLDIELKLLSGVEVGMRIREEMDNQTVQIVYISAKDTYYRQLFEVRPMHFLDKPIDANKIIKDIKMALKLSNKLEKTFCYKQGHEVHKKLIKDIYYFESMDRQVKIVSTDGEDIFYAKLQDVFKQVEKYHFLYIHKSFVANYDYVIKFKYEELIMSNYIHLPISQPRRKKIRELQLKYEKEGLE